MFVCDAFRTFLDHAYIYKTKYSIALKCDVFMLSLYITQEVYPTTTCTRY